MSDSDFLGAGYYDGDYMDAASAMEAAIGIQLAQLNVSLPVRVVAYDATKQQVKVQPVVQRVDPDGQVRPYPPIAACPVVFPAGGGYALSWDLQPGDLGLLVFASAAIGQWVATGQETVRPESGRRGSLSDGVFYPGLRPQGTPLATLAGGGLSVGKEDGTARLHISSAGVVQVKGGTVEIGPSPTDKAALASLLDAHLTALKLYIDTPVVAPSGGGPCVHPTGPSPAPPATVGSSTVKVSP